MREGSYKFSHELLFGMKSFWESIDVIDVNDEWSSMTALFRVEGGLEIVMRYGGVESRAGVLKKVEEKLCEMRELTEANELVGVLSGGVYLDQLKRYDAIKLLEYYVSRFELLVCN